MRARQAPGLKIAQKHAYLELWLITPELWICKDGYLENVVKILEGRVGFYEVK